MSDVSLICLGKFQGGAARRNAKQRTTTCSLLQPFLFIEVFNNSVVLCVNMQDEMKMSYNGIYIDIYGGFVWGFKDLVTVSFWVAWWLSG